MLASGLPHGLVCSPALAPSNLSREAKVRVHCCLGLGKTKKGTRKYGLAIIVVNVPVRI